MAHILNIETATTNCSVSIAKNGEIIALKENNSASYSHSEELHNFIREALFGASLSFQDLNAIAVSKGPGSYTGLRIGVSAVKGLCFSLDIPLISVPTLESMAHQVTLGTADFIIPVLDARRMEVYSLVLDGTHHRVRETKAEIVDETSFQEFAKKGKVHLVGSGAEKCRTLLKTSNFSFDTSIVPSAREMGKISYQKFTTNDFEDVAYFEPYYLKDFILQGKKPSS
ncbi:MAG: tRNA (adenosine(37)-N6)-threonylcarbamoyltransferase complex dimerization subunit type 1 TsaB [Bacteroidota bacterium]